MHGFGIYYYADGSRYDGQWKNDKKHGWGKFYNSKGVLEYEGRYEDDKRLF
jgi:antitoxin component YwqK of YwqJK toxin-antitoxin module